MNLNCLFKKRTKRVSKHHCHAQSQRSVENVRSRTVPSKYMHSICFMTCVCVFFLNFFFHLLRFLYSLSLNVALYCTFFLCPSEREPNMCINCIEHCFAHSKLCERDKKKAGWQNAKCMCVYAPSCMHESRPCLFVANELHFNMSNKFDK